MSIPKYFTFKQIYSVVIHSIGPRKVPLGRWSMVSSNNHEELKVLYSNEDHCGTCADFKLKKNSETIISEDEHYYDFELLNVSSPDIIFKK
tara:strand:+ start:465 stop:737 length:273 start_codon:yes stop_codon:yes gene_type:complete